MIRSFQRLLFACLAVGTALAQRGPTGAGDTRGPGRTTSPARRQPAFSVREDESGWWFVRPDGRRLFSLGVCVVQPGASRGGYDPENPSYASWRQWPDESLWATHTASRLGSWGFTTLGAWSDTALLDATRAPGLLLTPVLHAGASAGAPWWDLWDERNLRRMEETARTVAGPLVGDPRVVGYYSDNELGWWNASLWKSTLEQGTASGQRRRLVAMLREHYDGDWKRLAADFDTEAAANWRDLERGGMVFLRPGSNGIRAQRRFLGLLAERYYSVMRDLVHRLDPSALYLGDRYQSFYYPEVAIAAAPYVDVVSCNLNAPWIDGTFPRFQLDTLHRLTRRPIVVGEFYLAATDNRSGNRNSHGSYPVVADQPARARAAATTLRQLAGLPQVVGADWFQFSDEPRHGRADGENFNFGLVDVDDHPYQELTAAFASFDAAKERVLPRRPRPDARAGIPRSPADPFARFDLAHALGEWDRERGFVPAESTAPMADLYVAWNPRALCLGMFGLDIVESAYYRSTSMPKVDRALWNVAIDGKPIVRARIGAGREALTSDERVRVESLSGMDVEVRNVAAMEIPASVLGKNGFARGDTVDLDIEWITHARAYRVAWRGKFHLD